jgi:hypothetical protein
MNDFVEQCRRAWKRLGVSDPLAEEMATDLASDLSEAETEGVSLEELLGSSAFNPASFATTWAAERGAIPPEPTAQSQSILHRPLTLIAVAVLAFGVLSFVVLFGAVLVTHAAPPAVTLRRAATPSLRLLPGPGQVQTVRAHTTVNAVPLLLLFLLLAIIAFVIAWLWTARTRSRRPSAPV